MEKKTSLIVFMMIVVVIIIIILAILLYVNTKKINHEEENPLTLPFANVEKIENKNLFFNIDYQIKKYFNYKKQNNINAIKQISNNQVIEGSNFISKEMYTIDKISNITTYVHGILREESKETDSYIIVNFDYSNNTFEIINSSKEEFENASNNIINSKYQEDSIIEKNQYNLIEEGSINDFYILKIYFEDYKFKALNKQEDAFELLDNEYRNKKFNNDINSYKSYIEKSKEKLQDANIIKYNVEKTDETIEYVAIDNFSNYYKIIETGINEYTIILDNYTLLTDEQVNKYNSLTEEEKVTSNMDKVMKLINEKNYTELYSYINSNFKEQNYPTQEAFETFVKQTFFENNIVGTMKVKKEGDNFIIIVPYKESLSTAAESREATFIMHLGNNMNFEISFSVE